MVDVLEKAGEEGLALTFDDVLLVPAYSDVVPANVDLNTNLTSDISLKIPLISADMDTVSGADMARAMALQGGIGFLWKSSLEEQVFAVEDVKNTLNRKIDKPISVGSNKTKRDVLKILERYQNRFSSLVVVDEDRRVVGLVTGDKTRFAKDESLVRDFMVEDVIVSGEDTSVLGAYNLMKKSMVPKLILTDSEGRLAGMYCFGDVKSIIEGDRNLYNVDARGQLRVGANIGVNDLERAERLLRKGCDVLLIGTAHGYSKNVIETVKAVRDNFKGKYDFGLVAGNVATYEGARALFEAGADAVKVGIGPGSICTTRVVAGAGVPQMTAIYEVVRAAKEFGRYVIADGGIRYSGDIVKAMGAGASCVMMGSVFAGAEEAPGESMKVGGQKFKSYRGMGSQGAMKDNLSSLERYSQKTGKMVPEGVEGMVPYKGKVCEIIFQYLGGLRSGMGYVGAKNILELQKAKFNRVTNAGQVEARPHDVEIIKKSSNYK
ncbi:IMP dehydrogenase [Candidatus Pacearchaeota archaeon]|nr:IMP dehydrogenase [Candidatus Pacearchaeota archaeon]